MTAGRAAARDLRYGRRGGRWAEGTGSLEALEEIAALRARTIDAHRRDPKKNPPWPSHDVEDRAPKTAEEWQGRARMARARQAAGVPLDHVDRMALHRTEGDPS